MVDLLSVLSNNFIESIIINDTRSNLANMNTNTLAIKDYINYIASLNIVSSMYKRKIIYKGSLKPVNYIIQQSHGPYELSTEGNLYVNNELFMTNVDKIDHPSIDWNSYESQYIHILAEGKAYIMYEDEEFILELIEEDVIDILKDYIIKRNSVIFHRLLKRKYIKEVTELDYPVVRTFGDWEFIGIVDSNNRLILIAGGGYHHIIDYPDIIWVHLFEFSTVYVAENSLYVVFHSGDNQVAENNDGIIINGNFKIDYISEYDWYEGVMAIDNNNQVIGVDPDRQEFWSLPSSTIIGHVYDRYCDYFLLENGDLYDILSYQIKMPKKIISINHLNWKDYIIMFEDNTIVIYYSARFSLEPKVRAILPHPKNDSYKKIYSYELGRDIHTFALTENGKLVFILKSSTKLANKVKSIGENIYLLQVAENVKNMIDSNQKIYLEIFKDIK